MANPFAYSLDNKRYHTLHYYNQKKYGAKVYKAVLDCGFSCPNKDGTKGYGGCIFCDSGSGYFTDGTRSVREQLAEELMRIGKKAGADLRAVAYFQANTNTYAPAEQLCALYDAVLEEKRVVGISVGTRADCLGADVLDCLESYSHKTNLTVELGMQSVHDQTLVQINRGYLHAEFEAGFERLRARGIRTCLHIINGLPDETEEMMLQTAKAVARLNPDAVKIQMLHVIRGTRLAQMYENGAFSLLDREEYIDIVVRQLELLPPEMVIERVTGDGDKAKLIAPLWSADKIAVLGGIDKRQRETDSWQGKRYLE